MNVKCPSCGEVYLETTEAYNPDVPANGTMFRLTPTYGPQGHNWSIFPPDSWIIADAIECPGCGSPIVSLDGRTIIIVEEKPHVEEEKPGEEVKEDAGPAEDRQEEKVVQPTTAHVCPECGKVCKNQFALIGHMKSHGKG